MWSGARRRLAGHACTQGWRLLVALFSSLALSIVGFAVLGFQLYGAELEGFSEFIKAVNTLIAMTRGLMDYTAMSDAQPVFNPVVSARCPHSVRVARALTRVSLAPSS